MKPAEPRGQIACIQGSHLGDQGLYPAVGNYLHFFGHTLVRFSHQKYLVSFRYHKYFIMLTQQV